MFTFIKLFSLISVFQLVLGANFTVRVGGTGSAALTFQPETVTAAMGDIVNFEFVAGNHTATQSTFDAPCVPSGFRSGFRPVGNSTNSTTFSILVNTTNPIWVYCAQGNHCRQGMVFAVNAAATGNRTFEAYKQASLALAATNGTTGTPSNAPSGSSAPSGTTPSGAASSSAAAFEQLVLPSTGLLGALLAALLAL